MSTEQQKKYEDSLRQGQSLPRPVNVNDQHTQNLAKAAVTAQNNKKP